jgi:hypothetical protein
MKAVGFIQYISSHQFKNQLRLIFILFFIFLFIDCHKKEEIIIEEPLNTPLPIAARTYWQIDSTDTAMKIKKINLVGYPTGTLTMDLDGDNSTDLKINVIHSPGILQSTYDCSIEITNIDCFISCDSIYSFEQNNYCNSTKSTTIVNQLFAKVLSYKDTLRTNLKWRQGIIHITYLGEYWYVSPYPNCNVITKSLNWPDNVWRYIGIKFKGKLGWIKMYSFMNKTNTISEFALVE